jgi:hypothetical protein
MVGLFVGDGSADAEERVDEIQRHSTIDGRRLPVGKVRARW